MLYLNFVFILMNFIAPSQDKEQFKNMLDRDERRFKKADSDSNGKMTLLEFSAFLHPENHDEMKNLVVEETLEDIDKDKDGSISLEEYIGKRIEVYHLSC